MDVVDVDRARGVLPRLSGAVLYIYGPCALYKLLNTYFVAVRRLSPDLSDLVEAVKYGLSHAPELLGFSYTVVEGGSDDEVEFLRGLEMSQLGKIIYVKCWKTYI
jgi:hypothetical protein